uniref:Uncharacterized protein n=1 Tax=Glossina austeni TaxID=7395 RepID=A0A1A9V149_GLOAU
MNNRESTSDVRNNINHNYILCCPKSLKPESFRRITLNEPDFLFPTALKVLTNEHFVAVGLSNGEVTAASPYINIQNGVEDEGNATHEEENDDEIFQDAEEEQMTECWLIPEDVNTVDTIFQAMTECQA